MDTIGIDPAEDHEGERKRTSAKDIKTKVLAEKRAHEIVKLLLEENISEQVFIDALFFITVDHYQDVTEERGIEQLCGYPPCHNRLTAMPKQQYRISNNKVYDITERKNFCSNRCFRSSNHVKRQISTSPLWFRDRSKMTPVTLDQSKTGQKGDEVKLRHVVMTDDIEQPEDRLSTQNGDILPAVPDLGRVGDTGGSCDANDSRDRTRSPAELSVAERIAPLSTTQDYTATTRQQESSPKTLNSRLVAPSRVENPVGKLISPVEQILNRMREWITDESLVVMQRLPEKHQRCVSHTGPEEDSDLRKAEKLKLLNARLDAVVLGTPSTEMKSRQSTSEEEREIYMERVDRLYKGHLHEKRQVKFKNQPKEKENHQNETNIQLPKVDSKDQMIIRRNILHEKLSKAMQDLAPKLSPATISQRLKDLIATFRLSNTDVMLKTNDLPLMGAALLYLLSTYDENIRAVWSEYKSAVESLLNRLKLDLTGLEQSTEDLVSHKQSEQAANT